VLQTRQKLKEAYDINFAATIERAEKQIILARHGRRLLNLLDDTPVVPGDVRQPFANTLEAKDILNDAEAELQAWQPNIEPISTNAGGLGANAMPREQPATTMASSTAPVSEYGENQVNYPSADPNSYPSANQISYSSVNQPSTTTGGTSGSYSAYGAATTGHHSSATEDPANPVQGEGSHLERAMSS